MWLQWVVPRLVHLSASEWAMPQAMKTLLKPCAALRRLSANWSKTESWIAGRNATFRMLLHEMTVCAVQGWTSVPPWTACCFICCAIILHNSVQPVWVTAHYSALVCGVSALLFLSDIASNRGERLALSFCITIILHYLCTAFVCSNDFILH